MSDDRADRTITSTAQMMFAYAVGATLAECEMSGTAVHPESLRRMLRLHCDEIRSRRDLGDQDRWGLGKLLEMVEEVADRPDVRSQF